MPGINLQRIKCDRQARLSQPSFTASFWRGRATRFELGLFAGGVIADVSEMTSVTVKVKESQTDEGTELMSATVAGEDLVQITASDWLADEYTAAVEFTNDECNLTIAGETGSFWMVIEALLESGERVIYAAGLVNVYESNAQQVGPPPDNPSPAISQAEADARYMRGSFRLQLSDDEASIEFYRLDGTYLGDAYLSNLGKSNLP